MVSLSRINVKKIDDARGPYARVTIENASKANCLSSELIVNIRDAFVKLREDDQLRLVILTGAGDRSFIGGANLLELKEFGPTEARAYLTLLSEANTAIRKLPVPVIARINGVCIGAGLEMAASCDIRVASAHARFGMPEVALDLPSVVEAALFPRMIGWGRTAWLLYRGDLINADMAERWGLIEKMSSTDGLDKEVNELVEKILSNGSVGIRTQKALMRNWERMSIQDGIAEGIDSIAEAFKIGDANSYIVKTLGSLKKK